MGAAVTYQYEGYLRHSGAPPRPRTYQLEIMSEYSIELGQCGNQSHVVRFSRAFEEHLMELDQCCPWRIAKLRLQIVKQICKVAKRSEELFEWNGGDQWVRTLIKVTDASIFDIARLSKVVSHDQALLAAISIQSNLFPGKLYRTWLEKDRSGVFVSFSILDDAIQQHKPLGAYLHKLKEGGEKCHLMMQLEVLRGAVEGHRTLIEIPAGELALEHSIASGKEGEVFTVKWRGASFAKKDFFCKVGFKRDVEKGGKISHASLVHNVGVCREGNGSMVMEILDGTLEELIGDSAPFQVDDGWDIVQQVAQGLEHLHGMNFTIGDLTLGNILLIDGGFGHHVAKIADYGGFTGPACDPAVDIRCFGDIACRILVGRGADDDVSIEHGYPSELIDLITDCCNNSEELDFPSICHRLGTIRQISG